MVQFKCEVCEEATQAPGMAGGPFNFTTLDAFIKHLVTKTHIDSVKNLGRGGPLREVVGPNDRFLVMGVTSISILEFLVALQHFGVVSGFECYRGLNCAVVTLQHFDFAPSVVHYNRVQSLVNLKSVDGVLVHITKIQTMTPIERNRFNTGQMRNELLQRNLQLKRNFRTPVWAPQNSNSEDKEKIVILELAKLAAARHPEEGHLHIFGFSVYDGVSIKDALLKEETRRMKNASLVNHVPFQQGERANNRLVATQTRDASSQTDGEYSGGHSNASGSKPEGLGLAHQQQVEIHDDDNGQGKAEYAGPRAEAQGGDYQQQVENAQADHWIEDDERKFQEDRARTEAQGDGYPQVGKPDDAPQTNDQPGKDGDAGPRANAQGDGYPQVGKPDDAPQTNDQPGKDGDAGPRANAQEDGYPQVRKPDNAPQTNDEPGKVGDAGPRAEAQGGGYPQVGKPDNALRTEDEPGKVGDAGGNPEAKGDGCPQVEKPDDARRNEDEEDENIDYTAFTRYWNVNYVPK